MRRVGSSAYTNGMSLSASEFFEAGMSLPLWCARRCAEAPGVGRAGCGFRQGRRGVVHNEAAAAYDARKADPSRAIPAETDGSWPGCATKKAVHCRNQSAATRANERSGASRSSDSKQMRFVVLYDAPARSSGAAPWCW